MIQKTCVLIVALGVGGLFACGPSKTQQKTTPKQTTQAVKKAPEKVAPKPEPKVTAPAKPAPKVLAEQASRQKLANATIQSFQANKIEDYKKFTITLEDAQYYCGESLEQQNPEYLERRYRELKTKLSEYFSKCSGHDWSSARLVSTTGLETPSYTNCKGRQKQYYVRYTYRVGEQQNLHVNFQLHEYTNPTKAVLAGQPYCRITQVEGR